MQVVEQKLHVIHTEARQRRESNSDQQTQDGRRVEVPQGFCRVNAVSEGSPAALAVSHISYNSGNLGHKPMYLVLRPSHHPYCPILITYSMHWGREGVQMALRPMLVVSLQWLEFQIFTSSFNFFLPIVV